MIEKLADRVHLAWVGWMTYLFNNCERYYGLSPEPLPPSIKATPLFVLRPKNVKRWMRQVDTPYADLSDEEKDSDREIAKELLSVFHETIDDKILELEEDKAFILANDLEAPFLTQSQAVDYAIRKLKELKDD